MSIYLDYLADDMVALQNDLSGLMDRLYDHSKQLEAPNSTQNACTVNDIRGALSRIRRIVTEEMEAVLSMDAAQLKAETGRRYREGNHPQTPNRET